jgi:Putative DNA-binding domain
MDYNNISDFYSKVKNGFAFNKINKEEASNFLKELIVFTSKNDVFYKRLQKITFSPNTPFFPEVKNKVLSEAWEKGVSDLLKAIEDLLQDYDNQLEDDNTLIIENVVKTGSENMKLEFKSSLRWDLKERCINKELEKVVLKTICAFSNSLGGHLFIGISDDNSILGLESDYKTLENGNGNKDKFELHLRNLLNNEFNLTYVLTNFQISFPIVDSVEICHVQVKKGNKPILLMQPDKQGQKKEKFYVRSGNQSKEVEKISEILEYALTRFPKE